MAKRERTDNEQAPLRKSKRLAGRVPGSSGLEKLPKEIFDIISGHVASGDFHGGLRDLVALSRTSRTVNQKLEGSPAGRYLAAANKEAKLARKNFQLLPKRNFREGGPVQPHKYVEMIGPGLRYLAEPQQTSVADKTLNIVSDWRRADALNKVAPYTAEVTRANGDRLIGSAFDLAEDIIHGPHVFVGVKALAKMEAAMMPPQRQRLDALATGNPMVATSLREERQALRAGRSTSTVENTPSPQPQRRSRYIPIGERVANGAESAIAARQAMIDARTLLRSSMNDAGR